METNTKKRAAIYVRLSEDKRGTGENVASQEKAARKIAADLGAEVYDVYSDNSRTAADPENKPRPEFKRLLDDAKAGRFELVICRHVDRFFRHPIDQLQVASVLGDKRITIHQEWAGYPVDVSTPSGVLNLGIAAQVALYEINHKKERQRFYTQARLAEGRMPAGGPRPFGFDKDKDGNLTIREDEAELIRAATKHVLQGGSLGAIIRSWNERGITAPRGGKWGYTSMRALLTRFSNAGIRQMTVEVEKPVVDPETGKPKMKVVKEVHEAGPATWDKIIDEHDFRAVREILLDPSRMKHKGETGRKHLLSHILRCGKCGSAMRAAVNVTRAGKEHQIYQCPGQVEKCRLSVDYAAAEDVVLEAVTKRLAMPDASIVALTAEERDKATEMRRRLAEIDGDERMLEESAISFASKQRQLAALNSERVEIEERLTTLTRRMTLAAMLTDLSPVRPEPGRNSLTDLAGRRAEVAKDVRARFDALDLDRQRQVIKLLVAPSVKPADKKVRPSYETARQRVVVTPLDPTTGEPTEEAEYVVA